MLLLFADVTNLLMSLALISSTAVGLAYAGRRAASLKPYSSLNESHYLCQRWALLQLLTCTAQRAQTSAAGRGENEQPASETLGTWIQWRGTPLVNGCWNCEYATLQLELKEKVKWKMHTQHQFIFPSAIPYMCVNFFTSTSLLLKIILVFYLQVKHRNMTLIRLS